MKKKLPKIDKLRVKPPTGYNWENGDIAFGKKEEPRKKTSLSTHKLF